MFTHGITFGGHPSCAIALANIEIYEQEGLIEGVRSWGQLRARCEQLRADAMVGDVRGDGYFYSLELVKDKETKETFAPAERDQLIKGFVPRMRELGVYTRFDDRAETCAQFAPPFVAGRRSSTRWWEPCARCSTRRGIASTSRHEEDSMAVTVRTLQNFIGGDWVEATGDGRARSSPRSRARSSPRPRTRARGRRRAARARAQPKWAALSAWERAEVCHDRRPDRRAPGGFARELARAGQAVHRRGDPDIEETAENFRLAAEDVKRMETAIIPSKDVNKRILTFRKPNGVYASITPWNFPTLIPVELIAPGIAAGNTIVCKPSEWTPIAMANFMQIMADAGLRRASSTSSTATARSASG